MKFVTGTTRYMSCRSHYKQHSRRDDLESIGYLMIYFLKGKLPWMGINYGDNDDDKNKAIFDKKSSTSLFELT